MEIEFKSYGINGFTIITSNYGGSKLNAFRLAAYSQEQFINALTTTEQDISIWECFRNYK